MKTQIIINHLRSLGELYFKKDETHKATIFNNAATNISAVLPEDFPNDLRFLNNIKGVGSSTINEIKECIATGTSKRLEDLKSSLNVDTVDTQSSLDKLRDLLKKNNENKPE